VEGSITCHYSTGGSISFYGGLTQFDATNEMEEGTRPEATFTVTPTNFDPVNGVEEGPVITGT
jgi:hypothetical protein